MTLTKAQQNMVAVGLSPYRHELNGQGTACVDDCPACRWAAEQTSPEDDLEQMLRVGKCG